ncbi:hypothetical protein [Spirosoma foliorum]|uniref:Uncharacterized protein n=1 Tax=Spirosoma foliorum TaxID=2710596 RepID=A0A7G5H0T5_9BACT|nr:hypothetical protein [Spirosoma foliorum]QMW04727.1 hypothetical protein H3H32_07305 [Spirosoma foliorum]
MVFSLPVLQHYLLTKHGILPERVDWSARLRQDLRLTDADVLRLLNDIISLRNVSISVNTTRHLTDVFDLMVFVLLRSMEELTCLSDFDLNNQSLMASDFPQFSVLACRMKAHSICRFGNKLENDL